MQQTNSNPTIRQIIGRNVSRYLRLKNIRPGELAETIQVTRQHVYELRRGNANITIDKLEAIAAALQVETRDLLRKARIKKCADDRDVIDDHDGNGHSNKRRDKQPA